MPRKRLSCEAYLEGIRKQDRIILSQAITLIESNLPQDQELAQTLLEQIQPFIGNSIRLGITGVPGVGKSTFIEALGRHITSQNKKLAVLAIDPSSQRTRGSILGDKTRMEELSLDPLAYIRPSPTQSSLGGVARKTREAMFLCEAAGFEVIFIETVGVGQSETLVHGMVDFFLLLMLAGAGDELQGIKRGIMEMADSIVINKADGDNLRKAQQAQQEYQNALHLMPPSKSGWIPQVKTCSALEKTGIAEIWTLIETYQQDVTKNGFWEEKRKQQNIDWMENFIRQALEEHFFQNQKVQALWKEISQEVGQGKLPALNAVKQLLKAYF